MLNRFSVFLFLVVFTTVLNGQDKTGNIVDSMLQQAKAKYEGVELLHYYLDTLVRKRRVYSTEYIAAGDEIITTADQFGSDSLRYFARETVAEAHMFQNEYAAARPILREALKIGQAGKDTFILYKTTYLLSHSHVRASEYDTALNYALKALPYAKALLPEEKLPAFYVYQGIGSSHLYLGRLDTAVAYYLKAQSIAEGEPELATNLFGLRVNLGTAKFTAEDYEGAISVFQKALSTYPETSPPYYKVYLVGNLGQAFQENQQSDSARHYAELLLSLAGDEQETLNTYYTLSSNIYEQQDSLIKAQQHAALAVATARRINNQHALGTSLGAQGQIERRLRNFAKADQLFAEAEALLIASGARDQLKGLRRAQVENYLDRTSPKVKAHFTQFINLSDSIESLEVKEAIAELETKYQTRIRQDSIAKLTLRSQAAETAATSRQRQLWLTLTLLAAVVTGMFFAIREARRRRRLSEELKLKNNRITVQNVEINHRTNNYLTSIIRMLREQQYKMKEAKADDSVITDLERQALVYTKLQGLLYTEKEKTVVNLKTYFKKLLAMVEESHTVAGDPLQLEVSVDEVVVEPDLAGPLARIVNELITNSVKYARRTNGVVRAKFSCVLEPEGTLLVRYEDDGTDAKSDTSGRYSSESGLELIEELTVQLEGERLKMEGFGYQARLEL